METRLTKKMAALQAAGRKGLFVYITVGVPDYERSLAAVKIAVENGADVIEVGLPFSDPMADGPVIQAASVQALKQGVNMQQELDFVRAVRRFSDVPLVAMGYMNNIYHYGLEKFVTDFQAAGLDGAIIPDLPHEESGELRDICAAHNFHLAEFITPGTTPARMEQTCKGATGFIYCVSHNGVTGVGKVDYKQIGEVCEQARNYTQTPLAVGFGIGSPEAAVAAAEHADAVIVGSAVVGRLLKDELPEAGTFIASLRQALDQAYCR
ncbi:MAG: tryptophan synthase subunit alpha [Selenomonas sp.]|jgi:tryptophan synthase alpha chain|nr:tryptophan synthase subunit alpha [Selenomonas sp.]MDD6119329.1 tryptophan synthase subunit alpha [Selenomonadaceae bacterium]